MLTRLAIEGHEEVWRVEDAETGLLGFIALHSTQLGPAAGGLRMRSYPDSDAALADVLNLSRGMSFKNAAANLPLGGGKAVILGDPATKTPALLRAMGRAIHTLGGRYWTAEDMGMSPEDMAQSARETPYVAGRDSGPFASGDPSPVTARGVLNAMCVGARHAFGDDSLVGRRIAVQGLGHVGWHLCRLLHQVGADLTVADTDAARVAQTCADFGAEAGDVETIHTTDADIFAPCAIGGTLNAATIPELRARLVAGAANNQLASPDAADALRERGILYLPDYVANGGGIINVAAEILRLDGGDRWVAEKLSALSDTMERVLTRARAEDRSPAYLADLIVGERLLQRAV